MSSERIVYRWFYDNIHSHYYNLLMKWAFFPFGGEDRVRRDMLKEATINPGEKILDMCCGTGNTTFAIARMSGDGSEIKAIDLSAGQISVAVKNSRFTNIEFFVMDASRTSFNDCQFDRVVIPHALHEMSHETRLSVLREAKRVLKEKGTLTVLEMDNPESILRRLGVGFLWFYWLPFNFETPTRRDMFKRGLLNEVKEAGFSEVRKIPMFKGVFQIVSARR